MSELPIQTRGEEVQDQVVKTTFELRKEIYDLLIEYCQWAGHGLRECVEYSIFDSIRADLMYVGEKSLIPKANELWRKIKEIESMF